MDAMQLDLQIVPKERKTLSGMNAPATEGGGRPLEAPLSILLHERMEPLESRWRALEKDARLSLHQSYDWCDAWAKAHDARLLIVEGVSAGRTQLILPLEIVRRGPVRTARLLATPFNNINTGLYTEAVRSPALMQALQAAKTHLARHFDLLLLEKVPLDWRGAASPFSGLPSVRSHNTAFQLPLLADFDLTLAQVNAKRRRKKFRTSERRLDALGGYEHVVAQTPHEAAALLDQFFRQKAVRFEAMGLPDVFRAPQTRAFFHRLAAIHPAPEAYPLELQAIRLKGAHDGRIVAIVGLSRKADHVICQFGSIDESLAADASPGELLFYLAIRTLCGEGVSLFDFGVGEQAYKRSWCNIETVHHDLLWPATTVGRMAAGLHRAEAVAKRLIKQNARAYALVQRLRAGKSDVAGAE